MPTVSKPIADKLVAGDGWYPGDHTRVMRIVEYTDMGGKLAYGLEYEGNIGIYVESSYIRDPRVYWEAE